MFTFYQN